MLQYGEIGKLGKQIKRLLKTVPQKENVKIIKFDDFTSNTQRVYEKVLVFLELKSDNKKEFPVYNKNSKLRSKTLRVIFRYLSESRLKNISEKIKRKIGIDHWSFLVKLASWNNKETSRSPLSKDFRKKLENYFEKDQKLLREILSENKNLLI